VPKRDSTRIDALFFLGASLASLCFLPLATFGITLPPVSLPWQRQVIGLAFSVICLLGALAGVSPSTCSRPFRAKPKPTKSRQTATSSPSPPTGRQVQKKGHHATCTNYASHVVHIGGAVYCAGCTGLVLGAAIALVGSTLHFFLGVPLTYALVVFWLGFAGVALGLLQHPLYAVSKPRHGVVRVFVNIAFVVGAFLLLASVADLTNNLLLEAYLLLATIYWIFTRIAMSRRAHSRICTLCGDTGCRLSEARG
jgi:hypothetical protein